MEEESFTDPDTAAYMNQNFVCIKVDREERPDIDSIYMSAVQSISGQGGWPLTVFLTPDKLPFFGGTYFPPTAKNGLPGFPELLKAIDDAFRNRRTEINTSSENIRNHINKDTTLTNPTAFSDRETATAYKKLLSQYDDKNGGFRDGIKFPQPMNLEFLLHYHSNHPSSQALNIVEKTISAILSGGIYDHIGGGIHRYATEPTWTIPHFEKMLYDNGLLLDIYAKAWTTYQKPLYKAIVQETATWALREMHAENGNFYSAYDADSEGEEGKFTVWKPDEIKEVLGEEVGTRFCKAYNITDTGNFEHGFSNPALTESDFSIRESLKDEREKLYAHRSKRMWPGLDKKQLTSWNSLLIRGLAEAGFALGRKDLFDAAKVAADFIWENLRTKDNRLSSVYYTEAKLNAYLDDYAYYAEALLSVTAYVDFFYPGESKVYLERSEAITQSVLKHFKDDQATGFYFTSGDHENLIARKKEWWDNATPSGNGAMLHVLSSLYYITVNPTYEEELTALRNGYTGLIGKNPFGVPHALSAFMADQNGIEVIKVKDVDSLEELRTLLLKQPWARRFTLITDLENQPSGYQKCIGTRCLQPELDPGKLYQ